ncbi:hypothetical protein CRG98_006193 [Punica granatum]|uniref:Uncharacterized protein n=1 Tax=Punica granatum TaxID=22663 RepID=A0A2I0KYJ0_PUNGR|nr:hypothetical protein CRG98_006193 [Punica granatum]
MISGDSFSRVSVTHLREGGHSQAVRSKSAHVGPDESPHSGSYKVRYSSMVGVSSAPWMSKTTCSRFRKARATSRKFQLTFLVVSNGTVRSMDEGFRLKGVNSLKSSGALGGLIDGPTARRTLIRNPYLTRVPIIGRGTRPIDS